MTDVLDSKAAPVAIWFADGSGNPVQLKGDADGNFYMANKSDYRGLYPATWYLDGTATTEAADTFYTSPDVSMYNHFEMGLTVVDSGNVTVSASIDGTTYADLILFDRSTEALFATAAITAVGQYYFDGKFKNIKVTSSAADTHTIIFSHSVK